jgi:Zn-dependent protease
MVAHEYAHAEAAYRQGDDTAFLLGRLTLNPLKHIDPFMTILLPVGLWVASHGTWTFGGAKPVPVNPRNYRQYRRGDIIVSLAGIATNLVIFVACVALYILVGLVGSVAPDVARIAQQMLWWGMWLNLVLAFFNLIPIPPLDGSHVLYHLLPPAVGLRYRQLYRFGFLPIMAISFLVPGVMNVLLWPADELMGVAQHLVKGFTVGAA